jgi:hypothetical protein
MKTRRNRLLHLLAAFALLTFTGDLLVDSVADLMDAHCAPQSSQSAPEHEKTPCSHCSCAIHVGAVVVADSVLQVGVGLTPVARLRGDEESNPPRLAGSIDHPPQIA